MDYLSENRYQLLFIDDDELMTDGNDAVEPVAGQQQQQQPQQQQQSKNKRNKNKNVIKPILEEKQSQQQQQTPRAAPEKKLPQQQQQQQQQPKQPQQQPQEQPKQQPQQQAQQQLEQQPKEQPKQQSQQQAQQQPEQQQPKQQQQPQFRYRQRIINNSNRYAGAGVGIGVGFGVGAGFGVGTGFGVGAYRGNSTRYAKTNNNNNNNVNNNNNLETDEGDGNNTQVVDDRKFITVEQWKAMRGERVKPIYNIRKPGEGEPNKKPDWKHMTVLQKNKDNDNNKSKLSDGNQKGSEEDNGLDYDASMFPQRVGRLQRIVDIEFKFKDDRRRSGAYRSGWMVSRPLNDNAVQHRTANQTQPSLTQVATNNNDFETASDQINMNDEAEFPTLG